ncbi:MAG TPA: hypothetical protein PK210_05115 [Bacteroidia bacterium]|nr:hypothetical protein [Bacteroidia bacterium]
MTYILLLLGSLFLLIGINIVRSRLKEAPLFRIKEKPFGELGSKIYILEKRHRVFHYWSSRLYKEDTGNISIHKHSPIENIQNYWNKEPLEVYIKEFEEYWNKKQSGQPLYKYYYYGLVDMDNESEN